MRHIWTPEEIERVRELAAERLTASEIGRIVGATKGAILGVCLRRGIPMLSRSLRPVTPEQARDLDAARQLREQGVGWQSIALRLGRSEHFYKCNLIPGYRERKHESTRRGRQARRQRFEETLGINRPKPRPSTLTDGDREQIRSLRNRGYAPQGIAAITKVPYRLVEAELRR